MRSSSITLSVFIYPAIVTPLGMSLKLAQSQKRFSPAPFTTGTPLADALFLLANRAILPERFFETFHTRGPNFPKVISAIYHCSGTLIALLARHE